MTTKNIPNHSESVTYYSGTPAETLINNYVITQSPAIISKYGGSVHGDSAVLIDGATGITLVNNGTIQATYSVVSGSNSPAYGVDFLAGAGQTISITNTSAGVIEDSGAYGFGVNMSGGTVVNAGLISGNFGPNYFGAGIRFGTTGAYIHNTGSIAGGIIGYGSANIVNAGKILGFTQANDYGDIALHGGGSVTNLSTGTIAAQGGTAYGIKITGGAGTVTNAGYINGGGGDAVSLTSSYGGIVIVDPGAKFKGIVDGGAAAKSTLELGSGASQGTLSGFNSEYKNFGTLTFAPQASWLFETTTPNTPGVIDGFVQGDTIDLTGFTATSIKTLSSTSIALYSGGTKETLTFGAPITNFEYTTGSFGTDVTTICFCAGTLIDTPDGEVPVQTLKAGDTVLTAHNGPRNVTWVGTGKVLATRGQRGIATPVIVRRGALGDSLPHSDLHVTKAHSLYIDDVLIPVEFLVNHRTILWDDHAQEVEIYHVELESHDILIANGVPAESYRDDGNRWLFQNANESWHLPPQEPYAPVLTGGPLVDAVWRRLLDRAGPRNSMPLTDDPDLHLVIDGERVDAVERTDSAYVFRLSAAPGSVIVASRVGTPSELGITRDPRSLGVALRRVAIRQGAKLMLLDADDDRLATGFHGYEPADNLRWTEGYAELPIEAFARFDKSAEVVLHLGGATHYPDFGEGKRQAAA